MPNHTTSIYNLIPRTRKEQDDLLKALSRVVYKRDFNNLLVYLIEVEGRNLSEFAEPLGKSAQALHLYYNKLKNEIVKEIK